MNIGLLLPQHARYNPDKIGVVFEDQRLTYFQMNQNVNQLANSLLGLGVVKGDKVATILPNCLELLEVYWAVAKIGAVVVPLSPLLRGVGLLTLLKDSESSVVITDSNFVAVLDEVKTDLPSIREVLLTDSATTSYKSYHQLKATSSSLNPPEVKINDDDPYNIIYSSGTTGLPKGIVHTHYIRAMYCTLFASAYRMKPESVILHAGSIIFNGAFLTLMPSFYLGAKYILQRNFEVETFIKTIEKEQVTHLMMVPSQIIAMLNSLHFSEQALQSIEMICSVGAPLHKEHKQQLNKRLPNRFYELYGLTEGFVTILDKNSYSAKPDSVGVPPAFFEMKILNEQMEEISAGEVGEIVGRGPILMPGYYNRPDLTKEAIRGGWLHTGDLGYTDEDGFLYLVDRKKDMIISGSINIFPRDIEEIIVQHPSVREAVVFGVPDEKWGETPIAVVVLRHPEVDSDELRDWINARVHTRYQRVQKVVIMEEFPRNSAGKILKRVMREPYWSDRDTKI